MRTGRSIESQGPPLDPEKIMGMISLFIKNGMVNAAKYVECCQRNGITQEDIVYGLIYEVFEFLSRPNLQESIEEFLAELNNNEDYEKDENLDDIIVDDNQVESFSRINQDLITPDNEEFITKIHQYFDNWDSWEPQDQLEIIIKKAIVQSILSIKYYAENDMDIDAMEVELN